MRQKGHHAAQQSIEPHFVQIGDIKTTPTCVTLNWTVETVTACSSSARCPLPRMETTQASGGGAAVGWVKAGRAGWKPALKVRLILPCLGFVTYSLLSVH